MTKFKAVTLVRSRRIGWTQTADPSAALGMTKGEGSVHLSNCYRGWRELYAEREANDPSIRITSCRGRNKSTLCHPDPDFLYVAPSITACAAFSKESRMRFANANELHRKSGGAQPRDLQFSPPHTTPPGPNEA